MGLWNCQRTFVEKSETIYPDFSREKSRLSFYPIHSSMVLERMHPNLPTLVSSLSVISQLASGPLSTYLYTTGGTEVDLSAYLDKDV